MGMAGAGVVLGVGKAYTCICALQTYQTIPPLTQIVFLAHHGD